MEKPRALVLTGQGINCDEETRWALEAAGAEARRVHLNDFVDGHAKLSDYQMLAFPGGFSYGDDIGAGQVLAKRFQAKLKDDLLRFIEDDKLVVGFCNGFQAMVKMGILPGIGGNYRTQTVTLAPNDSNMYEDRWVFLSTPSEYPSNDKDKCFLTKGIRNIYIPVAHGEGKFYSTPDEINRIEENGLVVFRYSLESGKPAEGRYPENPNGSLNDIAGICDPTGRVFGMMPHPERFLKFTNHPNWAVNREWFKRNDHLIPEEGQGMKIFRNAVEYFK